MSKRRELPLLGIILVLTPVLIFVFQVALSIERQRQCEARGGEWFGRSWVCMRGEHIPLP